MKLEDLIPYFLKDTKVFGKKDFDVESLKAMHLADEGDMTFILKSRIKDYRDLFKNPATVIITDYEKVEIFDHTGSSTLWFDEDGTPFSSSFGKCIIQTSNPRLQMAKFSHLFDYKKNSYLFSETPKYFPEDIEVGEGTILHAGVVLYSGVKIGKNCIINAGTVIGADGFGYEPDENGEQFKIAHLGEVVIGDNVEIGANTCIDRGTLGNTIIEDNVKIDNLCHIAHNVHMKKNSVAIALSMIAGSCVVDEGAWVAPCSALREGRKIGKDALVGLGSVVVKDVEDGQTVMGVPAKSR